MASWERLGLMRMVLAAKPMFGAFAQRFWALVGGSLVLGAFSQGCMTPPTHRPRATAEGGTSAGFDRDAFQPEGRPILAKGLASNPQRVVWLGVAATVVHSELSERFPVMACGGGNGEVGVRLSQLLERVGASLSQHVGKAGSLPGLGLVEPGSSRPTDLGMALLVNKERWREELTFEGKYRREYGVLGQLAFFDQARSQLVASYPLGARVSALGESKATLEERELLVRKALMGEGDGRPSSNSILGQFMQALGNPRIAARPPFCLEVGTVTLSRDCRAPVCLGSRKESIKEAAFDAGDLALWEGEIGAVLVNHLGHGTGYVFNPYVARGSGKDNLLSLNFLGGSPQVLGGRGSLSLRLPDPARRLDLKIDALSCEVDDEFTGKYVVNLIYGFRGSLTMYGADDAVLLTRPFDVSLAGFQSLPRGLRESYWQNARRKLLPAQFEAGNYDPRWNWRNSLDNFLDRLALELFFPKADVAGHYRGFRESLAGIRPAIQ